MADRKKRYFWLQLKEDFFDDDTMEYIEEQPNGKEYALIYLKMCLKSLKLDGYLKRMVGNTMIPYDIPTLAKLVNSNVDTVRVAMRMFEEIGLVKTFESGEIYMNQIEEMIGSETEAAKQKRIERAKKEVATLSQDGRKNVAQSIEYRDKSIENRDKSVDVDVAEPQKEETSNGDKKIKAYQKIVTTLEENGFGTVGGLIAQDINQELDDFAKENNDDYLEAFKIIFAAIKIAIDSGVTNMKFVWKITQGWYKERLFTINDVNAAEKKFRDNRSKNKQNKYGKPQRVEPEMNYKAEDKENKSTVDDVQSALAEIKEMGIKTKLSD